jgi:hypothetical protein
MPHCNGDKEMSDSKQRGIRACRQVGSSIPRRDSASVAQVEHIVGCCAGMTNRYVALLAQLLRSMLSK